jgi:hypothetical protein
MLKNLAICIILSLLTLFTAAVYALPPVLIVLFILLCAWLGYKKKRAELAMMLVSLLCLFACLEIFVRFNADDIFYREHERYALKTRYRADIDAQIAVRFGDLVAMDSSLKQKLAEPHNIDFRTDGDGFRNQADYANEPYVVLGDSFATSIGSTQDDILAAQMNKAMPGSFYSRAFPGAPKDYEKHALLFFEQHPDARYVWFMFEGNDFFAAGEGAEAPRRPNLRDRIRDYKSAHILPFLATRVMTLLQKTVSASLKHRGASPSPVVDIFELAGNPVGFLRKYMDHAEAEQLTLSLLGTPEIMQRTACVFFIPDKYRVYKPWISKGPEVSEPPAAMAALREFFGPKKIPVVDLTPFLRQAAGDALKDGKFVYWRDDTHWNAAGIASIVPAVKDCIANDKT